MWGKCRKMVKFKAKIPKNKYFLQKNQDFKKTQMSISFSGKYRYFK